MARIHLAELSNLNRKACSSRIPASHCLATQHTVSTSIPPILQIEHVSKSYGRLQALSDTSFEVNPGEIFALLGPNGAGKTTLIGCIAGLILRFSGSIRVAGHDVRRDARITRQLIGLVPQELNFDPFFNVEQVLHYQSGFYNVPPSQEKIETILRDFGLWEKRKANTRSLSGGMKRRLMICKALMHEPVLLFLDEPTAGVDVELRDELWKYVRRLKERGVTIFLTTHYLEEAEQLADRIGFIDRGSILLVHDREDLLNRFAQRWNRITLRHPVTHSLQTTLERIGTRLADPHTVLINTDANPANPTSATLPLHTVLQEILSHGNEIVNIDGGRNSLESIFREVLKTRVPENQN